MADDKHRKKHKPEASAKCMTDKKKSKTQVLSHLLPPESTLDSITATTRARLSQKVAAPKPPPLPPPESNPPLAILDGAPRPVAAIGPPPVAATGPKAAHPPAPKAKAIAIGSISSVYELAAKAAGKELAKDWEIADFGQGHIRGGTNFHKRNRLESVIRLLRHSESLGHFLPMDSNLRFPAWLQTWDERNVAKLYVKASIGRAHADFLKYWQKRLRETPSSFVDFLKVEIKKLPKPEVFL